MVLQKGEAATAGAGTAREHMAQRALLLALFALCLARGLWYVHGLSVPPDDDMIRDLGFIQGLLDGNAFGDPTNAGAWRWYPPLAHALAAAAVRLSGAELMPAWIQAGPWLGLLTPLAFFAMNARLIGRWGAVAATAVLVLFNGAVLPSDATIGYTPLALTPSLAWPVFFLGVLLIQSRAGSARFLDAVLIGSWLGLAFLIHTVPALLLSVITAAAAMAMRGVTPRTIGWLAAVALTELAWGALFLAPLAVDYRLHIANTVPGAWSHLLLLIPIRKWFIAVNLPGAAAAATILALRGRYGQLPRLSAAILLAWILVCLGFLARHYACGYAGAQGGACGTFVIAAHHYEAYLQAAWATLIGHAVVLLVRWARVRLPRAARTGLATLGALAVLAGCAGFLLQSWDLEKRREALARPEAVLDAKAYRWLLQNTTPQDLFVTPLPPPEAVLFAIGPATGAVMAAGRHLVAAPELHSNPYLDWSPREAHRLAYLQGFENGGPQLCAFAAEAKPGTAYFLLPLGGRPAAAALEEVTRTGQHVLYRVRPGMCAGNPIAQHPS